MNKNSLLIDNNKKQNNRIKVTSSYLFDNPSKEDVQKLQKEIQHILLTCIHLESNKKKLLKECDKEVI